MKHDFSSGVLPGNPLSPELGEKLCKNEGKLEGMVTEFRRLTYPSIWAGGVIRKGELSCKFGYISILERNLIF